MIYVECYPDQLLVRVVAGLQIAEVPHEFQGKGAVVAKVIKRPGSVGLVDQDPSSPQPRGLTTLQLLKDYPNLGLEVRGGRNAGRLVVVCPRLEEWAYRAAQESQVDPESFRLPATPKDLKNMIDQDLHRYKQGRSLGSSRFERLLRALIERKSRRIDGLREAITAKPTGLRAS